MLRVLGAVALLTLGAAGCLTKGDTNVNGGPAEGELPTCANVCGAVTSNDVNWCGCGAFASKDDRPRCIELCEGVAPSEDALRCTASAIDCDELLACGTFWPAQPPLTRTCN